MIRFYSAKWMLLSVSILAVTLGCGESKKSLHEMDHVTPAHWPSDLADAANKLSERVKSIQAGASAANNDSNVTLKELRDLVGWVPEVAADTDLAENDWVKLYDASESIRKKLLNIQLVEASLAEEINELCSLLVHSQTLIPQPVIPAGMDIEEPANTEASAE